MSVVVGRWRLPHSHNFAGPSTPARFYASTILSPTVRHGTLHAGEHQQPLTDAGWGPLLYASNGNRIWDGFRFYVYVQDSLGHVMQSVAPSGVR